MKKKDEEVVYKGEWINVKKIYFEKEGRSYHWETVERVNTYGAIIIVARLLPSRRVVLLKQYRPVIENYMIAFPQGIAEKHEIAAEALRELWEETGYQGTVTRISPPLKSNPALLNDQVYIVNAIIDETISVNQKPSQHLEASEEIEVLLVEEQHMQEFLVTQYKQGYEIGIGPWYAFALDI